MVEVLVELSLMARMTDASAACTLAGFVHPDICKEKS